MSELLKFALVGEDNEVLAVYEDFDVNRLSLAHPVDEVADFMEMGDQEFPEDTDWGVLAEDVYPFLHRCHEEWMETLEALGWDSETRRYENEVNIPEVLDGFIDLAYVALTGAVRLVGREKAKQAWDAVVEANRTKVDGSIGPKRRDPDTGKILKPEGWNPPDIEGIVST